MGKKLVIVESVAKTKTISKFLGKDYIVKSSVGHIKDLPKQRVGIDIENDFLPEYIAIKGKGKVIKELRKAAQISDTVYIATDPDREGEAIASHLEEEITSKNKNILRVMFNEITERAVKKALAAPLKLNVPKVDAQKARRVVDRLVGYQVSPLLWRTIYRGLSAGRVQSVALRLLCERESKIDVFKPEEYWTITGKVQADKSRPFLTQLARVDKKKATISNQKQADGYVHEIKQQPFTVEKISRKPGRRRPSPPFTTSTLQQEAARRLGYTAKRIMLIAQQLYEGIELGPGGSVGLITYMRTDSTRISTEALDEVREHIAQEYGADFLPASPRIYKVKSSAQDAHEAIRPTAMQYSPKEINRYLSKEQFRLYELIWNRFVSCQMTDARQEQTTIEISAGPRFLFRTTGTVIVFHGFLQVYEESKEEAEKPESSGADQKIPGNLKEKQELSTLEITPKQHFTKPPARFSESSLVKELDTLGIGRPSTYATIISTLLSRQYAERNQRQLVPTELGKTVNLILVDNFPDVFNVKFTAYMEQELDKVEAGGKKFAQVVKEFYSPFHSALKNAEERRKQIKEDLVKNIDEKCPDCKKNLVVRWGRNGQFKACSGYPDCRFTEPLEKEEVTTQEKCEKCGKNMVVKMGRYGKFLACSGYPECKNAQPLTIGVNCPKPDCGGRLVERKSKRGKPFYGCTKYPKCDFASWNKPVNKACENCGNNYIEERYSQAKGSYFACPKCKATFNADTKDEDALISS